MSANGYSLPAALAYVYELAEQNALDPDDYPNDDDLFNQATQQQNALTVVHQWLTQTHPEAIKYLET